MAKRNVVTKKNVEKEVEQHSIGTPYNEAELSLKEVEELAELETEIELEETKAIVAKGNKVRKATSFGAILKGINEVRKMRLKKFKDEEA